MKAAYAQIDLDALSHNLRVIKQHAPDSKMLAVVKANGYGHGLLPVANTLEETADGFGVARIEEGLTLRAGGIVKPILLLEGFVVADDLAKLVANNFETVVHCKEQLDALENAQLDRPLKVWLKLDTGMHRLGVRTEEFNEFVERLSACKNVSSLNFMTHFGCADELDSPITPMQIKCFNDLVGELPGERSLAASSACLSWPDSHAEWVRPGISLYGVSPFSERKGLDFDLKPAMTLTSSLIAVRKVTPGESIGYGGTWVSMNETRVGVIAIGYGDGYPRMAPNGTPVLVNGRKVPVVGRVSMDMLMVDLGRDAEDKVGDEAILWGQGLPAEEVAAHIGTIAYELLVKLTSRVILRYS
ncbi:alanine racemase [Veronia pacifica]|uniref:Alanine racemase n=1 Tax=Veronia pacifica TaxID=1080227 RepID=A0A1C3ED47_9GAMM|nr:alanine racemase [Veronia pacifica]ODA31172.1 alanine racemase [Veronia pacifica]